MTDCSQRLLARRPHIMRMLNIDKDGKTSETFYPMCPYCNEHFWQLGCWSIGICRSNHFCPRCGQNILWDSLTNEEVFKIQQDALERKIRISKHEIAALRKRITGWYRGNLPPEAYECSPITTTSNNLQQLATTLQQLTTHKGAMKMPEELIQKIEFLLINEGHKDQRIKWGEWIKYTPCEVGDILRKYADELSELQFIITREANKMGELKKPPLGLEPRWVHDSKRVKNILDAIERYTDANMPIPKKWVEELKDLFNAYFEEYPVHTATRR